MTGPATIRVRPAAGPDLDLIAAWGSAFFAHLKAATNDPWFEGAAFDPAAFGAECRASLDRGDHLLSLAELDGAAAGYLYGRLERPFIRESPIERIGHVAQVWVEPPARGRGVARALVADAEAWFRERGAGWAELGYNPANKVAAAAWTALGFGPYRVYARRRI